MRPLVLAQHSAWIPQVRASSASRLPSSISAVKQDQWNTAVLAQRWAFNQFSSAFTFRPQRAQFSNIALLLFSAHAVFVGGESTVRPVSLLHLLPPTVGLLGNARPCASPRTTSLPGAGFSS